jgi:hypothetical protein
VSVGRSHQLLLKIRYSGATGASIMMRDRADCCRELPRPDRIFAGEPEPIAVYQASVERWRPMN